MASIRTLALKARLARRAAETQQRLNEQYEKTHPSKRRTSSRWMGRTKGLPYSRFMLKDFEPAQNGKPARLFLVHPTKAKAGWKTATPGLIQVFYPSLPPHLADAMLGH